MRPSISRNHRPAGACIGRVAAGFVVAALVGACATMQSSQLPPDALRSGIRSGALVGPGDKVNVVTADGKERAFTVASVDAEIIRGRVVGNRGGGRH